jgi:hypothetical protein
MLIALNKDKQNMAGTKSGGKNAAETKKKKYDAIYLEKYGMTFYQYNGSLGGKNGRTGGFACAEIGKDGMDGRTRARVHGAKGGRMSRRAKKTDGVKVGG